MNEHKLFIGGEWLQGERVVVNHNPSDLDHPIGEYHQADVSLVNKAVDCAAQAAKTWAKSTIQQRADLLDAIGSELLSRKEELGRLLANEEGKILAEAMGEVARAGYIFKFFAGEALRCGGEYLPSVRPNVVCEISREPVGVVAIITPWNFPIAIPAWKIAPALAFGNTVLFKPADLVPGSAWALTEIIARALKLPSVNAPAGVFNLVMARGSVVGASWLNDARVNALSFTGSVETGKKLAAVCAANMKKVQLEMGGKNPLVILDDADLSTAVESAINGAYFSTGQRCTASSRLIVTRGIHDAFVEAMIQRMNQLKVGHAVSPTSHIGPVVDEHQLKQDLDYIKIGQDEGAQLVCGGNLVTGETRGHFLSPALLVNSHNEMRINREEIFGPVASVIRVADFDEALRVANDTPFGLASGIITQSLKMAKQFQRESVAGMVMVNLPTAGIDYHVPFGGRKGSSYGPREQGTYAREFYTTVKTSYLGNLAG